MNLENEHSAPDADNTSSTKPVSSQKPASFFEERPPLVMEAAPQLLRHWTRRDVLLIGAGAIAALVVGGSLLPQTTLVGMFVANLNAAQKDVTLRGKPPTPLWLRAPMQVLFIALLWWSTRF